MTQIFDLLRSGLVTAFLAFVVNFNTVPFAHAQHSSGAQSGPTAVRGKYFGGIWYYLKFQSGQRTKKSFITLALATEDETKPQIAFDLLLPDTSPVARVSQAKYSLIPDGGVWTFEIQVDNSSTKISVLVHTKDNGGYVTFAVVDSRLFRLSEGCRIVLENESSGLVIRQERPSGEIKRFVDVKELLREFASDYASWV